jgi:hypothetical protein
MTNAEIERENTMDAKSYCDSVGHELTGLKARLYDTIRKAESVSGDQKGRVQPLLGELNTIMDDLDARIARLARECPADFSSDRTAIDGGLARVKEGWKKVYGALGEEEYGLGGA